MKYMEKIRLSKSSQEKIQCLEDLQEKYTLGEDLPDKYNSRKICEFLHVLFSIG